MYGNDEAPPHASHYIPKFTPGARLPHSWINVLSGKAPIPSSPIDVSYVKEYSEDEISNRTTSTLDLCGYDSFTMIVGSKSIWNQRVDELQTRLNARKIRLSLWASGLDFEFVFPHQKQLFLEEARILEDYGLLIRPDQHILALLRPTSTVDDVEGLVMNHLHLM